MELLIFAGVCVGICFGCLAVFCAAFLGIEAIIYLTVFSSDRIFAFYNKHEHQFDRAAFYISIAVAALVMFLILQLFY